MGSVSVPESVQSVIQSGSLETKSAQEVVRWALETFGNKVALASSFSAEDVAIIHMMVQVNPKARVFTLDTGRLNQETYDVMDKIREKCQVSIEVMFPNTEAVERMVRDHEAGGSSPLSPTTINFLRDMEVFCLNIAILCIV